MSHDRVRRGRDGIIRRDRQPGALPPHNVRPKRKSNMEGTKDGKSFVASEQILSMVYATTSPFFLFTISHCFTALYCIFSAWPIISVFSGKAIKT
jgi:hypothetical protein